MQIEAGKAYLCPTLEDAEAFLLECDKQGIQWCDGTKASNEINYNYGEDTCYFVNPNNNGNPYLTYDEREYYEDECEITVYSSMTDEERAAERAAMDTAWKEMMQIEEQPK